jgi:hypothetical protein
MNSRLFAVAIVSVVLIFLAVRQGDVSENSAVELSMRMRGHDLTGKGAKSLAGAHPAVQVHSTASPHASSPMREVPKSSSSQQHAKPSSADQLWKTEQAMKKQLDADTTEKSGSLWEQTVDIVHKSDPNAKFIQESFGKQAVSHVHGPHHAKAGAASRLRTKSLSMKARLKQELNEKVRARTWALVCPL